MRTVNYLDQGNSTASGLFFITSGEVRKAIGKFDPFDKIVDPAERVKKLDRLSTTLEREINKEMKIKLTPAKVVTRKTR